MDYSTIIKERFEFDISDFSTNSIVEDLEVIISEAAIICPTDIFDICVSLGEILQNTYLHGVALHDKDGNSNNQVSVEVFGIQNHDTDMITIFIIVSDYMKSFNILQKSLIDKFYAYKEGLRTYSSINDIPVGGWGTDIILSHKDEICYTYNQGNIIFIRKRVKYNKA